MGTATPWNRALLALRLLAADPGLGGIVLRARAGPVRDAFLQAMANALPTARKLHPAIDDEQLFGGLDLTATLAEGRMVTREGLIHHPGPLVLTMAERAPASLTARLALHLDTGTAQALIALDEGADPDESVASCLAERLAFHVDLTDVTCADLSGFQPFAATAPVHAIATPDQMEQIVTVALALGVQGARASCLALRTAQAHAALNQRSTVQNADMEAAVELVLVPRSMRIPTVDQTEDNPAPDDTERSETEIDIDTLTDDMLIEAARALLPPDLLDRLAAGRAARGKGAGAGAKRSGNRHGRPLPARRGHPDGQNRIDLVATLRAAAPWQTLRRHAQPERTGILIRPSDIHIRRTEETSDRLLIFTVDASGSAAFTRLAEAKGAVELMLAAAYSRRDYVALIAFRGNTAEVLLPATRSLVRTKRQLAALPGGGGTPLAAGLMQAMAMGRMAQGRGMTPTVALLTDGRANITLEGRADRALAGQDAETAAKVLRATGVASVVIDMGLRPEPALARLARTMGGAYLALPRADARRISGAIGTMLAD